MAERLPRIREPLPLTLAVPRGRALVRQGERAAGLWILESGALIVTAVSKQGRAFALDVLGAGDVVGEPDGRISPVTVRSLVPSGLRPLSGRDGFAPLAERASRAAATALDMACCDVATRVKHRLDDLASRFGVPTPVGTRIALPLTQDDLAALTGSTRESVNRVLCAMERQAHLDARSRGRWIVV
jgi:CRP/FNR family cyclic AMP-dependent transcriptional regulator